MTARPVCVQTNPTTEETEMTEMAAPDHGRVTDDPRDALASALLDHLLDHEGYAPSPKLAPLVVRLANVVLRAGWAPRMEPRVLLPGDTIPAGTYVVDRFGDVTMNGVDELINPAWADVDAFVEAFVPDRDAREAAVAAEQERRAALSAAVPSPEAGSPVSAPEPREGVSVDAGRSESATAGDLPDTKSAQSAAETARGPLGQCEARDGREAVSGDDSGPNNPAARLRRAADELERRAAAATPGPWQPEYGYLDHAHVQAVFVMDPEYPDDPDESIGIGGFDSDGDNRWSVLLGPQVAEPLVAWLRAEAAVCETWERAANGVDRRVPIPTGPLATAEALRFADVVHAEVAR